MEESDIRLIGHFRIEWKEASDFELSSFHAIDALKNENMSNIFASLASGTKFSGKRNQEAIDIFRSKGSSHVDTFLMTIFLIFTVVFIVLSTASKQSKQVIDLFGDDDNNKGS